MFAKGVSITVRGPSSSFIVLRRELLQAGVKPQAISVISLSMEKRETDFCVLSRLVNIKVCKINAMLCVVVECVSPV